MNNLADLTRGPALEYAESYDPMAAQSPSTRSMRMRGEAMSDDELIGYVEQEESLGLGSESGVIANERAKALEYYFGMPFGNEVEGRSEVISTDVSDAIEGLLPGLLKPFISSDQILKFEPTGPKDEAGSEQETTYVNYVMTQRNNGPLIFYTWFKDALMQKNGVVKYYWEEQQVSDIERYRGCTEDDLIFILHDERMQDVEIIDAKPYPDPEFDPSQAWQMLLGSGQPVQQQPQTIYDVTLRRKMKKGRARIENVPPEELLISADARTINLKEARFVEHRKRMTLSSIRQMGYYVPDDITADRGELLMSPEYTARRDQEELETTAMNISPENREVLFRECYYHIDYDGDGIAELRRICIVGKQVLCYADDDGNQAEPANEEWEDIPFSVICPYITPHKYNGQSVADKVMDIQLQTSTLLRQYFDNLYTINNNRLAISNRVNLDDVLDEGIPGVVRVDSDQVGMDIMPLPVMPIGQIIEPMLQRLANTKMIRVGYSPMQPELDENSINKTATGVNAQTQSTQDRQELIARMFAETGVKDLMIGLHGLLRRHATKGETVRLCGQWAQVDPREWAKRMDMTVTVGLGNSSKQQQLGSAQLILQAQAQANAVEPGLLVTPKNAYSALTKLTEAAGFKDTTQFFTDPTSPEAKQAKADLPPPPPSPDQIKAQTDQQRIAMEGQKNQASAQLEMQRMQFEVEKLKAELQIESQKLALANRELALKEFGSVIADHLKVAGHKMSLEAPKAPAGTTVQ